MKKILSLMAVMLMMAFTASAETWSITDAQADTLINTLSRANDGDVIVLASGTYVESGNYLVFEKNITVKAADNAATKPIIQMEHYAKVQGGKHVVLDGLQFDGSTQVGRDQYFRFYDNNANELVLNNCEFVGVKKNMFRCETGKKFVSLVANNCKFTNSVSNVMKLESSLCGYVKFDGCEFSGSSEVIIRGASGSHLDSCIINNCYFHNNHQQSVYFEAGTSTLETVDRLAITNSTFANTDALTNWISVVDVRPYASDTSSTTKVIVDHCTFYNNPCVDSGHANIRTHYLSDVTVSNCIFAHPSELAQRATYCDTGGSITNCLAYNFTKDTGHGGHAYGCTVTNCKLADPLFDDLANNKYSFKGNFVTGEISPARGAATDGSDLGDPRWYTPNIVPNVDFATPYAFVGQKASLKGLIERDGNNYLLQQNNEDAKSAQWGTATWRFHATTGCSLNATLNMSDATTSGHIYKVEIFDANDNSIGSVQESGWDNCTTDKQLGGMIVIPAEGDYRLVLSDLQEWSGSTLKSITLSKVAFYLAGSMTEWGTAKVLMEEVSGNLYKATFTLGGWNEFKLVENDNWHGYGGINKVDSVLSDVLIQNTNDPNYNFGFNLPAGASISTTIYWNNADKKAYVKLDPATLAFNVVGSTTLGLDENPAALVNDMTNNGDGTFTLVKTNVALAATTNYWYKVACYHKWDLNYGDPANTGDENNMYVNVPVGGIYNITFNFDWNTKVVSADAEVQLVDGYYLMGNNNGYTGEWNISALNMDRLLSLNPGNASEYMITTTLAVGNEFKIVKVQNGALSTWYPDGTDNNYIVGAGYDGLRTVYFRPSGNGGDGWHYGYIYNSPATYEAGILAHTYATLCLPYAATLSNGKFYSVKTADAGAGEIVIEEQDGSMVAGKPYIISAVNPAAAVVAYLSGDKVTEPVANGIMIGNLSETPIEVAPDANNYILQADQLHLVVAGNPGDKVTVGQYKAYFHTAAALAPSAIRIVEGENNATNINNVEAKDEAVKFFENGILLIRRNGVTYDVTGRAVK